MVAPDLNVGVARVALDRLPDIRKFVRAVFDPLKKAALVMHQQARQSVGMVLGARRVKQLRQLQF